MQPTIATSSLFPTCTGSLMTILEDMPLLGRKTVNVTRSSPDANGGYSWSVTYRATDGFNEPTLFDSHLETRVALGSIASISDGVITLDADAKSWADCVVAYDMYQEGPNDRQH